MWSLDRIIKTAAVGVWRSQTTQKKRRGLREVAGTSFPFIFEYSIEIFYVHTRTVKHFLKTCFSGSSVNPSKTEQWVNNKKLDYNIVLLIWKYNEFIKLCVKRWNYIWIIIFVIFINRKMWNSYNSMNYTLNIFNA